MAKYKLTFWEKNGYDDSDFFCSVFDDETGMIEKVEVGSTRYHCQIGPGPDLLSPTLEIVRKAVNKLAECLYSMLRIAEDHDVLEPQHAARGDRLRLLKDGTFKDKKTGQVVPFKAGQAGVVIWEGAFGTFYRNGYNKPNRQNIRVGLKLDDGKVVFVGLKDCRKDQEPLRDSELRLRADVLAPDCQFSKLFGAAWDTDNYALAVLKHAPADDPKKVEAPQEAVGSVPW